MTKIELPKTEAVEVAGEGPLDADIILIGEAPAKNEIYKGRPFVGEAGQKLDRFLALAGLPREAVRITNVCKVRAPKDKMDKIPQDELQLWESRLIDEINELPNPKVLVPLGNYACRAVAGLRTGITKLRGCPIRPIPAIKHDCVVVPTFHPASILRHANYANWILIVADLTKAGRIIDEWPFKWPEWEFIIQPKLKEVFDVLKMLEDANHDFVVFDIENPNNLLSAIGFAWDRSHALCIPFYWGDGRQYWTFEQELELWNRLGEVMPKLNLAAQNALFDFRIMAEHDIWLKGPERDSMLMHHCLYSEMRHRLDVITSIYTDLPYYKTDEDEERGSALHPGRETEHWQYNCMDCIGTYWAIEELEAELKEEKMDHVYQLLYADILPEIFRMNMEGVPVDMERLANVQKEMKQLVKDYTEDIKNETGVEVNANSPQQVADLLFNRLGWAPYKGEKTGKKALEKLAYKYKSDIPNKIIDIRAARKELGLFAEENIIDGRVKCEYSLARTSTGRFASKKGRGRGGMNLQNVKHGEQRRFFVPLPGHIMLSADQRQAEAMCVAWISRDEAMQELVASGKSMHVEHGKRVYGDDFNKKHPLYRVVKGLVHGGNYGLGPWKFAWMTGLPFGEAKPHLQGYHDRYPGIRNNFHRYVESEIRRCRTLYNPFGRRQVFLGKLEPTVFQAGYAFIPQSTVTDINKQALGRISKHYTVLLETHDGLVISVPETEVKFGIEAFQEAYDIKFEIWGMVHTIPIEITAGPNWEDQTEIV